MSELKIILIIDDDSRVLSLYSDYFSKRGYNVVSAFEGEDGLKKAKELKPDLILLDIILPIIKGIDVLRELKRDETTRSIPVIVLTNTEEPELVAEAMELGCSSYLIKTSQSLDGVNNMINEVLKQKISQE